MSAAKKQPVVRYPSLIHLSPLIVCMLAALFGSSVDAFAVEVQYRQGQFPNSEYQHLGSEIRGSEPTVNFGSSFLIRVGGLQPLRTVLGFDLVGIPSNADITSITLQMHANSISNLGATVNVHHLQHATHSMVEGTANGLPDPVGVNWNRVQKDGTNDILWATPGGDFDATVLASALVEFGGTSYTFESSVEFVAAANDALHNNGALLELMLNGISVGDSFVRFDSDDSVDVVEGIEFRPLLTISYDPVPVAGDFDGDGDADGTDFLVWQRHVLTPSGATQADGDADGDGDVDGDDLVVWRTNFASGPGSGFSPVPEPQSIALLALGVAGLLPFDRGQRRRAPNRVSARFGAP